MNNFMLPVRKNSQKQVKIQKSTDNHLLFNGLIQENIDISDIFRLFPIISISQNFFSIFFLTLEKIGIDEKVICYHNISN